MVVFFFSCSVSAFFNFANLSCFLDDLKVPRESFKGVEATKMATMVSPPNENMSLSEIKGLLWGPISAMNCYCGSLSVIKNN